MPARALKSFAREAHVSMKTAEAAWKHAKEIVKKERGAESKWTDQDWGLVMHITQNILGLNTKKKSEKSSYNDDCDLITYVKRRLRGLSNP